VETGYLEIFSGLGGLEHDMAMAVRKIELIDNEGFIAIILR
jgi:hypothetical protein